MPKKIPSILPWSVVALAALALTFFWLTDTKQDEHDDHDHDHEHEEVITLNPQQIEAAGIRIQAAQAGQLQEHVMSPGKIILNADRIAHIYPKVSGVAKEVRKNLGESVKGFETIALLESQEAATIKAAYLAALQKEKYSLTMLQLEQNLSDKGVSVLQEYETSLNKYEKARLALEVSKQNLYALGLTQREIENLPKAEASTLRFYELRAPFEGNILTRHITIGELLSPSSEVYTIGDMSKLWVEISLYPQNLPKLSKGQNIALRDMNGRTGEAELLYMGSAIDEDTRRIQAIALLDNSEGQWQPGTFVTVTIASDTVSVPLAISKDAVQKMDGQDCAFIVNETGFEIRPIKIGRTDGSIIEVLSGIAEGEHYAASNSFLLKAEHEKDEAEHMH